MNNIFALWKLGLFLLFDCNQASKSSPEGYLLPGFWERYYENSYRSFSEERRLESKKAAKEMFYFGYDSYMKYAFPQDELNPIDCTGRGPDLLHPENININDVLGNFSLTLIDSLDTLAIIGDKEEFKKAVHKVITTVDFDLDTTVQVFETNIRILGSLLSAHLLIIDSNQTFGDLSPDSYNNELLTMAHDLAVRLMPAFNHAKNGIPFPRVNLRHGIPNTTYAHTATAGAGSLLMEFGTLSRLTGDPSFENAARRAVEELWLRRNVKTGLVGAEINVTSGQWRGNLSGLGAGIDSFFEYLLKAYVLFGEEEDLKMFDEAFDSVKEWIRRGRAHCNYGTGDPPVYVNVDVTNGAMINTWVDSLQAFLPGLLVLNGDIEEAICCHALFYAIWRRFDALPERFNWHSKSPDVLFYPLRPELIESTYLLYRATKNPFYLHAGRQFLDSIERHMKTKCGYASLHNVIDKSHEDRMESFFLSETCKYLYLLFDFENPIHNEGASMKYMFTTEGHLLPINITKSWEPEFNYNFKTRRKECGSHSHKNHQCEKISYETSYLLPLRQSYFKQINDFVSGTTTR